MDCSTPGFPVLHHLLEFAQTPVRWVSDAIQPSYPLSSPSLPAFNLSQHQGLFQWVSSSHQVAKLLEVQFQHQIRSGQSLSRVRLFVTPWITARQASLSISNSQSLLKLLSIESVMPSNHLILCCTLLPLPSAFPSIRVFSNKSVLPIRLPKCWSFSFSISPPNEYSGLISFMIDLFDLLAVQGTLKKSSPTTVQKHQFFSAQLSL